MINLRSKPFWILSFGFGIYFGFWILSFGFTMAKPSLADSVWNNESASPYSTDKAYKVGDIINIIILESTSAQKQSETKTDIKDDLAAKLTHTLDRLATIVGTNNQVEGQWQNKYRGKGMTSRTSNVQARIASWVTAVLPNGNLTIKGKHKVAVNDEIQEITITGVVRPKDISGANTLYSYQIANAEVEVKGSGVVAEAESPGWITRLINWLF